MMMDSFVVAAGDSTSDAARALLTELDNYLHTLYPSGIKHGLDVESLQHRSVTFFMASLQGEAVGCGAYKLLEPGTAEVKLMYLRPSLRRRGYGKFILSAIEQSARHAGVHRLLLETGRYQQEALALYERFGFRNGPPFADYRPDPLIVFFEKSII
jgi:putative acetyltransferase